MNISHAVFPVGTMTLMLVPVPVPVEEAVLVAVFVPVGPPVGVGWTGAPQPAAMRRHASRD
jgi:hypothetical protein